MTWQTLVLIMATVFVGMAWWANASKRNKIYCTFIRINKTSLHKFVKMSSQYVVFEGKRRNIVPSCIVWDWWDKGIVHMLFPQTVATLTYSYASPYPIDPNTLQPMILSAEVRKLMNKEEMWRDYNKTLTPSSARKETFIGKYLPWISVMLVALLGVYVFVNMQSYGKVLEDIINRLNAIAR